MHYKQDVSQDVPERDPTELGTSQSETSTASANTTSEQVSISDLLGPYLIPRAVLTLVDNKCDTDEQTILVYLLVIHHFVCPH